VYLLRPTIKKETSVRIYFVASIDRFIIPIIERLTEMGYDCTLTSTFQKEKAAHADVIWAEWADKNALAVMNYVSPAKKILRIHAYEAYTNIFDSLNLEAFDKVIFVADHMLKQVESVIGKPLSNAVVIKNYFDISKFPLVQEKPLNNKIAYAGYFCRKKGIGELLLIAESFPDYEFHIAGELQENDYLNFFGSDKPKNLYLYAWQEDMHSFFLDKRFVINTSLRESFSVATVEAMLCGCIPIVRNWNGSDDIYHPESIYKSVNDIRRILETPKNGSWSRQYALEVMHLEDVIPSIVDLIEAPVAEEDAPPTLTVAITQTRRKYMADLLNSLRMQGFDFKVEILDNMDKEKAIGKCFNELADRCKSEWILYVGDDDYLADDYISTVMSAYARRAKIYPHTVGLLTATHAFDDSGKFQLLPHYSTGFWKADYVRKERFNETLVRQVDTEFLQRAQSNPDRKDTLLWFTWIAGYMYRQHDANVSGNKFTEGANLSQEKK